MANTPKLILSLTSPYARKVRIAALEKGLLFETVVDVPWNENTGVTKLNPLGKVPVWITDQGEAIYDSRVIVEYLDLQEGPALFPRAPKDRIQVKQLEAVADGVMDAALVIFAERKKRPAELLHPWWVERQFGKIHRGLAHLENLLGSKQYFHGDQLSVADMAVASALGYIGLRFSEDFSWQTQYPRLAAFYSRMLERPSFKETVPIA